jgi:hypothetical protein
MFAIRQPFGFVATLSSTRSQFTTDPALVKTWKTRKAAQRALDKYADTGIGIVGGRDVVVPFTR